MGEATSPIETPGLAGLVASSTTLIFHLDKTLAAGFYLANPPAANALPLTRNRTLMDRSLVSNVEAEDCFLGCRSPRSVSKKAQKGGISLFTQEPLGVTIRLAVPPNRRRVMKLLVVAKRIRWLLPRLTPNLKQGVLTVRVIRLIAATAFLSFLFVGIVDAQTPSQSSSGSGFKAHLLVVDIGFVLRNHPTMKMEIEKIEANMAAVDKEFQAKRDKILADMKALGEQFTEGTDPYIRQEKLIAEADTEFRLELVRRRKEFDEARALVLAQVHAQLTHVLKFACEQSGASAVLRVSREKLDPKKPQTIEMGMGQEVFYFNPSVDMTDWVIAQLAQLQQSTPAAKPQAATATRQAPGGAVQR